MPTWNDNDDSITSTVRAIKYVDQTEKEGDICLLCSEAAGINTIECGDCQLWLHFECAGVTKPDDMANKKCICRLCKDNLLYNTSNTSEHNTASSDTQQSHDQPIVPDDDTENRIMNALQGQPTLNLNQNANIKQDDINLSEAHDTIQHCQHTIEDDESILGNGNVSQEPVILPKNNKTKKPAQRNPKPKDSMLKQNYIAQLKNEVDRLRSTVELLKKNSAM